MQSRIFQTLRTLPLQMPSILIGILIARNLNVEPECLEISTPGLMRLPDADFQIDVANRDYH